MLELRFLVLFNLAIHMNNHIASNTDSICNLKICTKLLTFLGFLVDAKEFGGSLGFLGWLWCLEKGSEVSGLPVSFL